MPEPIDITSFLGIPFRDAGTGPEAYDCWGLVRAVAHSAGLQLPEYPHVPCDHHEAVGAAMAGAVLGGLWARQGVPAVLDVVLMSTHPGLLNHVGIMVTGTAFLHTTRKTGVILTGLTNERWQHAIRGFYRWQP